MYSPFLMESLCWIRQVFFQLLLSWFFNRRIYHKRYFLKSEGEIETIKLKILRLSSNYPKFYYPSTFASCSWKGKNHATKFYQILFKNRFLSLQIRNSFEKDSHDKIFIRLVVVLFNICWKFHPPIKYDNRQMFYHI